MTSAGAEAAPRGSLPLVCWNLHGTPFTRDRAGRLERAAARILTEMPDVVLLQEVWLRSDAERLVGAFGPAFAVVEHPRGGLFMRTSGLLALVRKGSGWTIARSRFHEFEAEASPFKLWQGDGFGDKGIQEIHLARNGARLAVLNTHLQAAYEKGGYQGIRRRQLAQLRRVADAIDARVPVIAAGDLNTRPHEDLYRELGRFWIDLSQPRRTVCACGTIFSETGGEGDWVDYVLARRSPAWRFAAPDLRRVTNRAPDDPYSDHHGLAATVELRARSLASLPLAALALRGLRGPSTRRAWLAALALGSVAVGIDAALPPGSRVVERD